MADLLTRLVFLILVVFHIRGLGGPGMTAACYISRSACRQQWLSGSQPHAPELTQHAAWCHHCIGAWPRMRRQNKPGPAALPPPDASSSNQSRLLKTFETNLDAGTVSEVASGKTWSPPSSGTVTWVVARGRGRTARSFRLGLLPDSACPIQPVLLLQHLCLNLCSGLRHLAPVSTTALIPLPLLPCVCCLGQGKMLMYFLRSVIPVPSICRPDSVYT